ncbi:MAG: phenylacetic acid degradation protein PaaY [Alphaproteobacteria bacterium]|nr:phenylacetic acid degradation protein PaaY [Alphaproteobacteria bacterium]
MSPADPRLGPQVYEIDGLVPVIHPTAFVHPTAVLIGDAIVGPNCYVGPCASMRGDFGRLILEEGANLQDNCTMHGFPGTDTVVEIDGHIGHGAILHGCRIGRNALVGMNAVIMDGAVIGPDCIVAAMAFVRAGQSFEPRSLIAGLPAKVMREVSDEELAWKQEGTQAYQTLARRSRATLRPATSLTEPEPDRPRITNQDVKPLYQTKEG